MSNSTKSTRFLFPVIKGMAIAWLLIFLVVGIRWFCIESYRISTDAMAEALHKGDYILVNKLPLADNPARNRVVLFTSPLLKDSADTPLFISRCIGMPGDTIAVSADGYRVNGRPVPRSPRALGSYFVAESIRNDFLLALDRLGIPQRNMRQEAFGIGLSLTAFEEYQLREELPEEANLRFISEQTDSYRLVVPRKDRAYRLDAVSLVACKEAIRAEAGGKAVFRDGKLYLDGRETSFFFFRQDYYWVLSDNTEDAVDSRHLGFIPADRMIGNAFFCWYSPDKQRIFKPVN